MITNLKLPGHDRYNSSYKSSEYQNFFESAKRLLVLEVDAPSFYSFTDIKVSTSALSPS